MNPVPRFEVDRSAARAVVEGRVLWSEPFPRGAGQLFGFEVASVLSGNVGASVLAVYAPPERAELGRFLSARPDQMLRLEVARDGRGDHELLYAHELHPSSEEQSTPAELVVREPTPRERAGAPLRLSAAAAATYEDQLIELVNQARWDNGMLPPLKRVDLLDNAAELHATNMANRNFHMHCDPDTLTQPGERMIAAGYAWVSASENIAAGYTSPAAVMGGWMASSGHRANILSTSQREIGLGFFLAMTDAANVRSASTGGCTPNSAGGPYFYYWTQNFGLRNHAPVVIDREAFETLDSTVDLYLYGSGWATQMRLRNENDAWSAWLPFSANVPGWSLSGGNGTRTVHAEIRNGSGSTFAASDTIELNAPCPTTTTIQSQTLTGNQAYQDCQINAGPALDIAGGTTTLEANVVRLRAGFSVAAGATLRVRAPFVP
jgi:uncharacterized protein YkwD